MISQRGYGVGFHRCFVELPVHGASDLTVANMEHSDLGAEHFNAGGFTDDLSLAWEEER